MYKNNTPRELGYHFPAEWEAHNATWLSWPHKEETWPGKLMDIYPNYCLFIKYLTLSERVCINVKDEQMKGFASTELQKLAVDLSQIDFFFNETNDAWCRDHGPAFLTHPTKGKAVIDWDYNAWGGKYPPYDLDDVIPTKIAKTLGLPVFYPKIIMEGGAVEFNGSGTILTSKSCLLNKNRNPNLSQNDIEKYLKDYYGQEQILWISDGIVGDDTDGHIDDTVRFVSEDTVLCVVEDNELDDNYTILQNNLETLKGLKLTNGKSLNIVELPMPMPVYYEDVRLPASYANFYICNKYVIVPIFNCVMDDIALEIIQKCFPEREIVGIDSVDIIWGLGSFHCLSQQEPA